MSNFFKLLLILYLIIAGCSSKDDDYIVLGSFPSDKTWVYLCGLTATWNSEQEIENRVILEKIANAEKIQIVAIKPKNRCKEFNNKLCWPHGTLEQIQTTYNEITIQVKGRDIAGIIGFSNGGFFLNQLVQKVKLPFPVISIASAGMVTPSSIDNNIYLIIGVDDVYHYTPAISYYEYAKQLGNLHARLIKHSGGHAIPESVLHDLIHRLQNNN